MRKNQQHLTSSDWIKALLFFVGAVALPFLLMFVIHPEGWIWGSILVWIGVLIYIFKIPSHQKTKKWLYVGVLVFYSLFYAFLLIVATATIYSRVSVSRVVSEESYNIIMAFNKTKELSKSKNYSNLNNATAILYNIWPEPYVIDRGHSILGNQFYDNFPDGDKGKGNVFIFGSNFLGERATQKEAEFITIVYGGVPSDICLRLIEKISSSFGRIAVNDEEIVNVFDESEVNDRIHVGEAIGTCEKNERSTLTLTSI